MFKVVTSGSVDPLANISSNIFVPTEAEEAWVTLIGTQIRSPPAPPLWDIINSASAFLPS